MKSVGKKPRIGFIGLGLMGSRMAPHLLKTGYPLAVYNRTISKTAELRKMGATVFNTTSELAKNVDVVITMVTGPKDVEEVYLGKQGIIKGAKNGLIAIDMSTVGPSAVVKVGRHLKKHGVDFLDAPVTGSVQGANNATLTIFVGGDKDVFKKVEQILRVMGKQIRYMGPLGSGQAIKLVNSLIIANSLVALSEAMILAEVMGLSRKKVAETLDGVPALSLLMNQRLPVIANNKYPLWFALKNMHKDVSLAIAEFKKNRNLRRKLKISPHVLSLYKKALEMGYGDVDFAAVFKVIEK